MFIGILWSKYRYTYRRLTRRFPGFLFLIQLVYRRAERVGPSLWTNGTQEVPEFNKMSRSFWPSFDGHVDRSDYVDDCDDYDDIYEGSDDCHNTIT